MSLTNIVENPKPGETIFSPELAARFDNLVTLYPRASIRVDSHAALCAG